MSADGRAGVVDHEPEAVAAGFHAGGQFQPCGRGERVAVRETDAVEVGVELLRAFKKDLDAAALPVGRDVDRAFIRGGADVGETPRQVAREARGDGRVVAFRVDFLDVFSVDAAVALAGEVGRRRQDDRVREVRGVAGREIPFPREGKDAIRAEPAEGDQQRCRKKQKPHNTILPFSGDCTKSRGRGK